jgi:hypothetical protein
MLNSRGALPPDLPPRSATGTEEGAARGTVGRMAEDPTAGALEVRMAELRKRADQDFLAPSPLRGPGRHQIDVTELGLRVAMTRSRYPNQASGVEMYAVTLSRLALDHAPAEPEVRAILEAAFGEGAAEAVERGGGPLVRMFRLPAG